MEGQGNSPSSSVGSNSSFNARSTVPENANFQQPSTFFIKVYMDGDPIGRKLNLFSLDGYESLIRTVRRMFRTNIICPNVTGQVPSRNALVLTYEDRDGDWMMVGDVPWEIFLTAVQRLRISRADNC